MQEERQSPTASHARARRRRRRAEINIVPLVDVLIVLIFFFLFSMQFRNMSVLNIVPPHIETAGENRVRETIEIGVSSEGEFFYNGREVTEAELRQLIRIAGDNAPGSLILILADETSQLGKVTLVMDASRKAGLENIRLQSR